MRVDQIRQPVSPETGDTTTASINQNRQTSYQKPEPASQPNPNVDRHLSTPAIILPAASIKYRWVASSSLRVPAAFQHCNFIDPFHIPKFFRMQLSIQITIQRIRQTGVNFHDRTHSIT
jgi:hypothetical protein